MTPGLTDAERAAGARLLARLDEDPEGVRRVATSAADKLPSVVAQFEGQLAIYSTLLADRGREAGNRESKIVM